MFFLGNEEEDTRTNQDIRNVSAQSGESGVSQTPLCLESGLKFPACHQQTGMTYDERVCECV